MKEPLVVDETRLKDCVKLICRTCEDKGFTEFEAGCAMVAILDSMKDRGVELGIEKRTH